MAQLSALWRSAPLSASVLAGCVIEGNGYGRVIRQRGYEQHGPHLLPLAVFAGGSRVAMYSARDAAGTWRHVYSTAPAPASASASRN